MPRYLFLHAIKKLFKKQNAFTLIELLIVIAIVAVLSTVAILTLNPAELLKQARDSTRVADLATINTGLTIFSVDRGGSGYTGTSSFVYVSLPDPALAAQATSTCPNFGLPSLPAGYSYHCVSSSSLKNTDGTGWIPVNFQSISAGSPLPVLPIDPINTTSSGNYYTYMMGGSWELAAGFESAKQKSSAGAAATDGGASFASFEIGSNLRLIPSAVLEWKRDSSLLAYWPLDEGSGSTAYDASGNNYHATWNGSGTHYVAGKVGTHAGQFNTPATSSADYILTPSLGTPPQSITLSAWIKPNAAGGVVFSETGQATIDTGWHDSHVEVETDNTIKTCIWIGSVSCVTAASGITYGTWYHVVMVYDLSAKKLYSYFNGVAGASQSLTKQYPGTLYYGIGAKDTTNGGNGNYFSGLIDDARIYNRALSASEVAALYSGTAR